MSRPFRKITKQQAIEAVRKFENFDWTDSRTCVVSAVLQLAGFTKTDIIDMPESEMLEKFSQLLNINFTLAEKIYMHDGVDILPGESWSEYTNRLRDSNYAAEYLKAVLPDEKVTPEMLLAVMKTKPSWFDMKDWPTCIVACIVQAAGGTWDENGRILVPGELNVQFVNAHERFMNLTPFASLVFASQWPINRNAETEENIKQDIDTAIDMTELYFGIAK